MTKHLKSNLTGPFLTSSKHKGVLYSSGMSLPQIDMFWLIKRCLLKDKIEISMVISKHHLKKASRTAMKLYGYYVMSHTEESCDIVCHWINHCETACYLGTLLSAECHISRQRTSEESHDWFQSNI